MSKLIESSIYDLLPPNLQDAESKALSAAFNAEFRPLVQYIQQKTQIYSNVSQLDESVCDMLALIFDIHAYEQTFDIETKRDLVQGAIIASLYKGTALAVQRVISAVHGGAKLDEWFDYGGDPFMFKIIVDTNRKGISINDYDKLMDNIDAYKSARSVLEGITVNLKAQGQMAFGSTTAAGDAARILPEIPVSINPKGTITAGSSELSGESAVIFPQVDNTIQANSQLFMACFLAIGEHTAITQ
jgi:phage tail P2-like protein